MRRKNAPAIRKNIRYAAIKGLVSVFVPIGALFVVGDLATLLAPQDSLIVDINGYGLAFAVPFAFVPLIVFFFLMKKKGFLNIAGNPDDVSEEFASRQGKLGNICLCSLAVSLVGMAYGSVFYDYGLTPKEIVITTGFLDRPHRYVWADVAKVRQECLVSRGRYLPPRIEYSVEITLKDGMSFSISPNQDVVALMSFVKTVLMTHPDFSHISYVYDTSFPQYCPDRFSVDLPHNQEIVSAYPVNR